jgi:dipeptidase E
MKLYLSSYRLGDEPARLQKLVGNSAAKAAVSVNALDAARADVRAQFLRRELADMAALGFQAEELDLRDYFSKPDLVEKMSAYDLVWLCGGNTFILAKAFRQSGFAEVLDKLVRANRLVYAGYSAAVCVLAPTLRGGDLVDDKDAVAEGYESGDIWDGYGLINFYPIVHYQSDHPESPLVDKELAYVKAQGRPYKTLRDGDVIIIDTPPQPKKIRPLK